MKITKIIAIACATFALVACGGEEEAKAWEKTDAEAYVTACTTADTSADAKARCTCQAAEMGKTVAYADKDGDDTKKEGYTKAETAAKTTCKDKKDADMDA